MAEIGSFKHFVEDLGMRIAAATIVITVFFGLGYVKKTDFLGLSGLLDSGLAFFSAAFVINGFLWILYLVYLFYVE